MAIMLIKLASYSIDILTPHDFEEGQTQPLSANSSPRQGGLTTLSKMDLVGNVPQGLDHARRRHKQY